MNLTVALTFTLVNPLAPQMRVELESHNDKYAQLVPLLGYVFMIIRVSSECFFPHAQFARGVQRGWRL